MCKPEGHNWLRTRYSRVCSECGLEEAVLVVDTYNKYSAPIMRGYNRCSRFKLKIDKLLCLHSGPRADDIIWKLFEQKQTELRSPSDIRATLRKMNVRNKHYDCVRLFTHTFTNFRVTLNQNIHHTQQYLLKMFNQVYVKWCMCGVETFFSYDFLLRCFLNKIQSPLIVYCKPATCKRRQRKYFSLLKSISVPNDYKMWNQTIAKSHSPNELRLANYHPCQQLSGADLLLQTWVSLSNGTGHRSECL